MQGREPVEASLQRGDCSHIWCYTPYFFAQLWMSLATALASLPKNFPREGHGRRLGIARGVLDVRGRPEVEQM